MAQSAMANTVVSGAVTLGTGAVALGTGYGLLTDQEFRSDYAAMEMASPAPGEGTVMFARGLGMAGRDIKMVLAAYWNSMKPAMGERFEQLLYRSGGLTYAVPPQGGGALPESLESQLARLYQNGLRRQAAIQARIAASPHPPVSFPGTTMVDIRGMSVSPGGRFGHDPYKLVDHGAFDWGKYHPIVIEYINGMPYVTNGMTRIENALQSGITHLPAEILRR